MPAEIRVPPLGEAVLEATVGKWLKQPGEPVTAGEPVVELETEKVNVEVTADRAGVLAEVKAAEGATVHPGDVLGVVEERAAAPAPPKPEAPSEPPPVPPAEVPEVLASPTARRLAAEHDIDLAAVPGSGPSGRIMKEDVLAHLSREQPAPAAPPEAPAAVAEPPTPTPPAAPPPDGMLAPAAPPRREERRRMSRRRQTIARHLVEAQRVTAQLTTFNEVDMTAVMELRRRRGEAFEKRHDVRLGLVSFFVKGVVAALKAFPMLNAEIQDDEVIYKHYYDIGIAVAADEGLVVPVVRDADRKSFAEIEKEIEDLATRTRENKLIPQELIGGTFTITNGGVFGSLLSTPILNYPQVGILGMHKIEPRPVVVDGQVVVRPMMYVALSYDHRLVDGREAVLFLRRLKELIEDPEALLLEG